MYEDREIFLNFLHHLSILLILISNIKVVPTTLLTYLIIATGRPVLFHSCPCVHQPAAAVVSCTTILQYISTTPTVNNSCIVAGPLSLQQCYVEET